MRHHFLTASILAILFVTACAKDPQIDAEIAYPPETISAQAEAPLQDSFENEGSIKSLHTQGLSQTDGQPLPAGFEGLDPRDISRSEIHEYIALQKIQAEGHLRNSEALNQWRQQDSSIRGPRPTRYPSPLSDADSKRFRVLEGKFQNAQIRKRYAAFDPNFLSKDEVDELVALDQEQAKLNAAGQKALQAWAEQNPATRGPRPNIYGPQFQNQNPRLQELRSKIESVEQIKRLQNRAKNLSPSHNITFSDSEISELIQIETEQRKIEAVLNKAEMDAQKETGGLSEEHVSEEDILNGIPKQILHQMIEFEMRKQDIEAPLKAAENADKIQARMAELSQESGIPILSGEIAEAITLNAEKDRIKDRTEIEFFQKWIVEGGPLPNDDPLASDEDYARMKEIDARLKAISAPMNEAKYAAREANNPALRQSRLFQEEQEKWRTDWQDKKQAGEIPPDTPQTSPTYAEMQDRLQDYSAKLEARADKVGYAIPEADMKRLDSFTQEMLAIRKSVYDMEADGTSHFKGRYGQRNPSFATNAGMFKIKLLDEKQREILAGLSQAEAAQNETLNSETGIRRFNHQHFGGIIGRPGPSYENDAPTMIEDLRRSGLEISQSEADDLIAFEQELQNK